jgi:DNA ligase (NAD+)
MNIDGMSEATLDFLINKGWVKSFKDIYHLADHKEEWQRYDGFGKKSVEKILDAIEKSRNIDLANFICALSIDGIGTSASKTIANAFNGSFDAFFYALMTNYDWSKLSDFGAITARNIADYGAKNADEVYSLAQEMQFMQRESKVAAENPFNGKTICVTGKLNTFTRDSINAKIAELGAKAAGSVSKNTDYLITNEASGSSKYNKAVELNVPIITEAEFLTMIGE